MAIKIQKQPVAGVKPKSLFSSFPAPVSRPAQRYVPSPPMRRPIPQPQMNRPMQSGITLRPPTGLPQQTVAPTGLPNVNQINTGLPNINQQPTGLPPTQMQMPTPAVTQPSASMFAPQMQQPMQQIDYLGIDPSLAQISGGPINPPPMQQPAMDTMMPPQMQQPMQQPPSPFANEPGRDSNGMLIPGYGQPPPGTFLSQPVDRPVAGPIAPDYQYNSDNTMRSIRGMGPDNTPSYQSQQFDPITGQYGMPDGTGGRFLPGVSIGY